MQSEVKAKFSEFTTNLESKSTEVSILTKKNAFKVRQNVV